MSDSPKKGAAFFDLDRTLIAGSSTYQFGRAAYKSGLLNRRQLLAEARANLHFRLHGSTDDSAEALRERLAEKLAGVRVRDLQRLTPDILGGLLPQIYPEMLEIAYDHQDAGRPVYVCTAAAEQMAELIATVFVFDGAVGSRAEVVNGCFTGHAEHGSFAYREGKAKAIRELAERENIDLSQSWAYSDSESDLPMLRAVGNAVAVNPDRALEKIALEEGWEVLHFDRFRTRLRLTSAALLAAAVSGVGSAVLRRRTNTKPPPDGLSKLREKFSNGTK